MNLREKIAEIISAADGRYEHADSDTIADAVMGVVEEDAVKRRAYTERRVEMARKAEAAIWERRIREQKEEGDAIIAEEQARVRELEDENQRMRDDLEASTVFRVGDVQVHKVTGSQATGSPGKWHVAISPASPRWVPSVSYDEDDVHTALSRARQIAEEET